VLDEAQAIKNPSSQSAKAARLLEGRHRLALTGTPIENHLGDLWSIFEFLNPGMLGANARFSDMVRSATDAAKQSATETGHGVATQFAGPGAAANGSLSAGAITAQASNAQQDAARDIAAEQAAQDDAHGDTLATSDLRSAGKDALAQLSKALRPFILRRTKRQVLTDLPAKTEQTILCEMESDQREVYDELRHFYRSTLISTADATAAASAGRALEGNAIMVLEALLRLRQAACHPALINDRYNAVSAAKLEALDQMLDDVIEEGAKSLVFSQFTSMLGLVRQRLEKRGIPYTYLDGQTRNRKQVVEQFQEDPDIPVFLISLKAGGVGLNLTAAEYVFILDPWWNPAVEAQAIDRTHRIGQTKPVFAYRLICEGTVEQRVVELQNRKRKLAEAVVGGEQNLLRSLTRDDLDALLS